MIGQDPLPWIAASQHGPDFQDGDQYLGKSTFVALDRYHTVFPVVCTVDAAMVFHLNSYQYCNGEPWGWEWDSVEFFIPMKKEFAPCKVSQ